MTNVGLIAKKNLSNITLYQIDDRIRCFRKLRKPNENIIGHSFWIRNVIAAKIYIYLMNVKNVTKYVLIKYIESRRVLLIVCAHTSCYYKIFIYLLEKALSWYMIYSIENHIGQLWTRRMFASVLLKMLIQNPKHNIL